MRLRNAAIAATSALALVFAVPTSANAATGDFLYKVGPGVPAGIADPQSRECINLFGATEEHPAFAPENFTTSTATVFLDFDCDGDVFYVMNPGRKLGDRLKLRSVVFS
ncbi:hypothetical protein [Streptomyces sp. CB01881]|uniref:hypothetical protein n=1 Tax=Streptomyces sp. CB01881 TaxID=2078691 RepID=UPI000CDC1A38|nr:hypothetical protein [Streptomyces sp. CB01881]AUY52858.1 hypothetical protein C2142_32545 [Streptomyces sp. CB01881]TYC70575.1 hypothetical protein EH183_32610 [Streptomyces sp. CB01881]